MPATILLVEDEPAIADTVLYALRTDGFETRWARTCGEASEHLLSGGISLMVLDVGLPDGNGFDFCKRLRQTSRLPIIFLTARGDEVDRIVGLEIGGDDYLPKPFSPRELTARVKAVLRRVEELTPPPTLNAASASAKPSTPARAHGFEHDEARCRIAYLGTWLDLTRYEYRVLRTLIAQPGRIFNRDQLMTHAWEDPGSSTDRAVDTLIKTLRAKLRVTVPDADPIQTHRGFGYSLRETA